MNLAPSNYWQLLHLSFLITLQIARWPDAVFLFPKLPGPPPPASTAEGSAGSELYAHLALGRARDFLARPDWIGNSVSKRQRQKKQRRCAYNCFSF